MKWDAFISHASEDKADVALPLAERLKAEGLRVWLDSFELTVGDSLRQSVEKGLAGSRFGIAIISPSFLAKHWPQAELDGLAAREAEGVKVILPVWHRIDAAAIRAQSPMLAGRFAATTDNGIAHVADQLLRAIRRDERAAAPAAPPAPTAAPAADIGRLRQVAGVIHADRTERIATGQGAVAVLGGGMLVLHIVPYAAIEDRPAAAFDQISQHPERFEPMKGSVRGIQINYDGLLIGSNGNGLDERQRAYVNVFRTGTVEAVMASLAPDNGTRYIELPHIQAVVIRYVTDYLRALSDFGIAPPFAVLLGLANVNGVRLLRNFKENAFPEDIPFGLLDRDRLPFGQCTLEAVPDDFKAVARVLRPILTHLANAAGLPSSPYFDADGNYTLNLGGR